MPGLASIHRFLTGLLVLASTTVAASDPPSAVKDLQYGEVLYYYFQKDYFNSIVRLQMAQQQQHLPNHAGEAELMLGGLDLSYGLRNEARRIFNRVLNTSTTDTSTRNRAWFYLAKISWQRGDPQAAIEAIGHVDGDMSPSTRTAAINLHSLLLMEQGDNQAAIELLEHARSGKHWSPYLNYNLGIALLADQQQQRGTRQLDDIGDISGHSEELRLLRDKANLALGYNYLQNDDPVQSRKALERVRLQGPLSNKALLGTGWADTENGDFGSALVPWMELSHRDATDPAVQESLLAIPYAMTKMDLNGRAVQHYNEAIELLLSERGKLDQSIQSIQAGDLQDVLLQEGLGAGNGWLQELYLDTDAPALRYQLTLMSSHVFQEAIKNYRDLIVIKSNLARWQDNIGAYDDMLISREARFTEHRPAAEQVLRDDRLQTLEQRRTALADSLTLITSSNDALGLATPEETRQLQQLSHIDEQLVRLPVTPETSALREKYTRLRGLIIWNTHYDYKPRLRQSQQQLAELDALMEETRQGIEQLQQADVKAPVGFEGFSQRIADRKKELGSLAAKTDATLQAQGTQLEELAIAELERQQQRVDAYVIQARFALAQTYDNALQAPATEADTP